MKREKNKTTTADTTKDAARLAVSLRRAQLRVQAMASAAEAAASLLDIGEAAEARLILCAVRRVYVNGLRETVAHEPGGVLYAETKGESR